MKGRGRVLAKEIRKIGNSLVASQRESITVLSTIKKQFSTSTLLRDCIG